MVCSKNSKNMTFVPVIILLKIYFKEVIIDTQIYFCLLQHREQKNGCDIDFHQQRNS